MEAEFSLIDVFSDRPFGGNQLAVFPRAEGFSDEVMQQLAREFNFAENTFVLPFAGGLRPGRAAHRAAREAKLRETSLLVVCACEDQATAPYAGYARRRAWEEEAMAAATQLEHTVETRLGPAPEIPVKVEVTRGLAARVLLDRAVDAGLLVLGGAASSASGAAGPVVRACLGHAPCPVVLVSQEQMGVPA
jgi:nucleotide-binding universal stress UspA family protein